MKIKNNVLISLGLAVLVSYFVIKKMRNNSGTYKIPPMIGMDGERFDSNSINDQVLIISYFQTWCSDCVKEQPQLQQLKDKFGEDRFQIIMVSDEPVELIKKFKNQFNSKLDFYHSEKALKKDLGVHAYPTTYLIGKDGKVSIKKVEGINWYTEEIIQTIETLLKD
ncbi:MAG: TlpA disulfide reductase family protein [Bacteroidia bacterium]